MIFIIGKNPKLMIENHQLEKHLGYIGPDLIRSINDNGKVLKVNMDREIVEEGQ